MGLFIFSFYHVKLYPNTFTLHLKETPNLSKLEYFQLLLKCGTEQKSHSIYRLNEGDNLFQMSGGQQVTCARLVLFCC